MIIDSPIISGSYAATGSLNQTGNVVITGSLTVTGTINGSITGSITTASYALNAEALDGLDSTSFTTTSSFTAYTSSTDASILSNTQNIVVLNASASSLDSRVTKTEATASSLTTASSSFSTRVTSNESNISSLQTASGSFSTRTTNLETASGSFSTRVTSTEGSVSSLNSKTGSYATTSSNAFSGSQTITGSLTVTGQITAQTLNVQQVTSSIVYSSGSNIFGNSVSNTQQFTGSLQVSGSNHYMLGKLGINTSSPSVDLTVVGNIKAGYDPAVGLVLGLIPSGVGVPNNNVNAFILWGDNATFGGNNGDLLYIPRTSTIGEHRFYTANTGLASEKMRITYDGNVGIGTTNPQYRLHVQDSANVGTIAIGNKDYPGLIYSDASSGEFRIDNRSSTFGYISFYPNGQTTIGNERMRIQANGNVGIGTTNPAGSLEVVGSGSIISRFNSTATNGGVISFQRSGTAILDIGTGLGLLGVGTNNDTAIYSTATMYLGANGTQFVTLRSGNVGIGTTSPGVKLDIFGGQARVSGSTNEQLVLDYATASGGFTWQSFRINGTNKYRLVGNVDNSFGIYNDTLSAYALTIASTSAATFANALQVAGQQAAANYGGTGLNFDFTSGNIGRIASVKTTSGGSQLQFFVYNTSGTDVNALQINSTGNIGIGTTSPATKLHISNNGAYGIEIDVANEIIQAYNRSTSDYNEIKLYSSNIRFFNGTSSTITERMRITSGGSIGIGTTSPSSFFHVNSGAVSTPRGSGFSKFFFTGNNASTTYFEIQTPSGSTGDILFSDGASGDYGIIGYDHANDSMRFYTKSTINMFISGSGLVGIGTTAPGYKLDVNGAVNSKGYVINGEYAAVSGVPNAGIYGTDSSFADGFNSLIVASRTDAARPIIFATYNGSSFAERVRIKSDGNVGIGTSTIGDKLVVKGTSSTGRIRIDDNTYSNIYQSISDNVILQSRVASTEALIKTVTAVPLQFGTNDSVNVTIASGGNVGIGTTSPTVKFHVNDGSHSRLAMRIEAPAVSNNAGRWTGIGLSGEEANTKGGILFESMGSSYSRGKIHIAINNAQDQTNVTTADAILTVIPAGSVGIGTTSPDTKLNVFDLDGSGARTSPINILTITADNNSNPYDGFGGGLLFKNRIYSGGPSAGGIQNGARIRTSLRTNSVVNHGTELIFDVTTAGNGSLTEALRLSYVDGSRFIGNVSTESGNIVLNNNNAAANYYLVLNKKTGQDGGILFNRDNNNDWQFVNSSTGNLIFYSYGTGTEAITFQKSTGNVGIGTTSPSTRLHVSGITTTTELALGDSYNTSVTTNSGWSSFQTIIPGGTLEVFSVYLITASYSINDQPYNVVTSFTFVVPNTNGSGGDNEFTPICATHTGGTGTMSFRAFAVGGQSAGGLQIKFNGFANPNGTLTVRATRIKRAIN